VQIELTRLSAIGDQETLKTKAGDESSSEQGSHTPYMSEICVMSFQIGRRNDPLCSSEKHIWQGREYSTIKGLFSKELAGSTLFASWSCQFTQAYHCYFPWFTYHPGDCSDSIGKD
jgi:hypothetical protein